MGFLLRLREELLQALLLPDDLRDDAREDPLLDGILVFGLGRGPLLRNVALVTLNSGVSLSAASLMYMWDVGVRALELNAVPGDFSCIPPLTSLVGDAFRITSGELRDRALYAGDVVNLTELWSEEPVGLVRSIG